MKRRNRKPITMERGRITAMLESATLDNRKCCIWLHIVDSKNHAEIVDELFEDIGKSYCRISFSTAEIPETPCIRSEETTCIAPEDAAIIDGELCDVSLLKAPKQISDFGSQVWHFSGGIWLIKEEVCFCEYDDIERRGGMIVFFGGKNIPKLLEKYPQLRRSIKVAKPDQYNWLVNNW